MKNHILSVIPDWISENTSNENKNPTLLEMFENLHNFNVKKAT